MSESDRENASIEDVMSSIRKAIEAEAEGESAGTPGDPPRTSDGVIHLTQMVTRGGEVVDLSRDRAPEPKADSGRPGQRERDVGSVLHAARRDAVQPEPEPEHPKPEADPVQENLGKVDPLKAAGAAAITKYLTEHPPSSIEPGPQVGAGQSLESVVRQALVPHVREWLEANLAPLVHNIVREEIEQMVRRKKEDRTD